MLGFGFEGVVYFGESHCLLLFVVAGGGGVCCCSVALFLSNNIIFGVTSSCESS